jgi:hypothetical protein
VQLCGAVVKDLGSLPELVNLMEVGATVQEVERALAGLDDWVRPEPKSVPAMFKPASGTCLAHTRAVGGGTGLYAAAHPGGRVHCEGTVRRCAHSQCVELSCPPALLPGAPAGRECPARPKLTRACASLRMGVGADDWRAGGWQRGGAQAVRGRCQHLPRP